MKYRRMTDHRDNSVSLVSILISCSFCTDSKWASIQILRSSAVVAVTADRTAHAHDVRYSYRTFYGIAVDSMSIYLFKVSNCKCSSAFSPFVAKGYILYSKSV